MTDTSFALVFPGQGSQSIGMLAELSLRYPVVQQTFEEASSVLGQDLWQLCQEGPSDTLNLTYNTQPALLCAGVAIWRLWRELKGPVPMAMAGHSLGEYTALVCAGAMAFHDAVGLVYERGKFMQAAVPESEGAMAAILGLPVDVVQTLCAQAAGNEVVEAANFNSPEQVVVAGHRSAVNRLVVLAKSSGAKRAIPLAVSVPSHCSLMRSAAEKFSQYLENIPITLPSIHVTHNATVTQAKSPGEIRSLLVQQLHSPVRWVETIRLLFCQGITMVIETGPGKVLTGLNKRIESSLNCMAVYDLATLQSTLEKTHA